MNTNTLDKMRKMKFFGMFHAFKSSLETGKTIDYTADELLAHLIQSEWDDRQNRRIERQLVYARFRYKASVEAFIIMLTAVLTVTKSCAWQNAHLLTVMKICSLQEAPALVKAMLPQPLDIRLAY